MEGSEPVTSLQQLAILEPLNLKEIIRFSSSIQALLDYKNMKESVIDKILQL